MYNKRNINKFSPFPSIPSVFEECLSYEMQVLWLQKKLSDLNKEVIDINSKLTSGVYITNDNLINNNKLDGDLFTGDLCIEGLSACEVVETNQDSKYKIEYLISQFSQGQTGWVIDGGVFEEQGIRYEYNGGTFYG